MKEYAKNKGLGKKSDVEAMVVRVVDHAILKSKDKPNFYDETFFDFEYIPHGATLKTEELDVWSSKRGYLIQDKEDGGETVNSSSE